MRRRLAALHLGRSGRRDDGALNDDLPRDVREGPEPPDGLASVDGFTCYESQEGTRCEKSWQNDSYPVAAGRTVFWWEGVLIDTRYSSLAPDGYAAQHDEWAERRRSLGLDVLAAARRVGEPNTEEVIEPDLRTLTA